MIVFPTVADASVLVSVYCSYLSDAVDFWKNSDVF